MEQTYFRPYRNYRQEIQFNKPMPTRHYWNGFDASSGQERYFIEFDNGTLICNKNSEYPSLVKRYFPNDN
jgi:hypothetical protein